MLPKKTKKIRLVLYATLSAMWVPIWLHLQYPELSKNISSAIPATSVAGEPKIMDSFFGGDHTQIFYLSWKLQDNIKNGINIYTDPYTFASKQGSNIDGAVGLQFFAIAALMQFVPDATAYNIWMVHLSHALLFLTSLFALRSVTKTPFLVFVGSVVISLMPYTYHQVFGGHAGGSLSFLVPLFLGALIRHDSSTRPGWLGWDTLAGLSLLVLLFSDEHQAYYVLLFCMFFFGTQVFQGWQGFKLLPKKILTLVFRWKGLILSTLVALGSGIIINNLLMSGEQSASPHRTFNEIRHYSRPLIDFFSWGSPVDVGNILWVGLTAAVILSTKGQIRSGFKSLVASRWWGLTLTLIIFAVLMAGVGPRDDLLAAIRSIPYKIAYYVLPFFSYQRVAEKMAPFVTLLAVVVICLLIENLKERQKSGNFSGPSKLAPHALKLGLVLQALLYFMYFTTEASSLVLEKINGIPQGVVDAIVHNVPKESIILPIPTYIDGRYANLSLALAYLTERRYAEGYNGFPPRYYLSGKKARESLENGDLSTEAGEYLVANGIEFILVDLAAVRRKIGVDISDKFRKLSSTNPIYCDQGFCLYGSIANAAKTDSL